jgi:hypothetical protein
MRLSPLSQVRSAITGKNRFPVTIRQIQVPRRSTLALERRETPPKEKQCRNANLEKAIWKYR